jgi:hypothetical protein
MHVHTSDCNLVMISDSVGALAFGLLVLDRVACFCWLANFAFCSAVNSVADCAILASAATDAAAAALPSSPAFLSLLPTAIIHIKDTTPQVISMKELLAASICMELTKRA